MNSSQSSGATFGTVGIFIFLFIAALMLVGALLGRKRGFLRQTVRTVTVILSLLISFLLISIVKGSVENWLSSQTSDSLISTLEGFGLDLVDLKSVLSGISSSTVEHILAIPLYLVVVPIIFVAIFVVVSLLMGLVHLLVCKLFRFHKWNHKKLLSKLSGLAIGAVQGLLVAVVCLSPFVGLASTISTAVSDMPAGEAKNEVLKIYDENISSYTEDEGVKVVNSLGAGLIYKSLATATVGGNTHDMSTEIAGPTLKLISAVTKLTDINWQDMTEADKTTLTTLVEVAKESPYTATILADLLSTLAGGYSKGTAGVESNGLAKELVVEILAVFDGINEKELPGTLAVVRDVFFMLSDEGAIAALGDDSADLNRISSIFTTANSNGKTLIDRLTAKLKENDRTKPLISSITSISVTAMAQNLSGMGGVEVDEETYENVKEGIGEIVSIKKDDYATSEEYVSAISDSLNSTLVDNGIQLEKDVVDQMAQHVADNYGDKENLSDEEIDSIILSYYSAYLESQNSGTVPEIPQLSPEE